MNDVRDVKETHRHKLSVAGICVLVVGTAGISLQIAPQPDKSKDIGLYEDVMPVPHLHRRWLNCMVRLNKYQTADVDPDKKEIYTSIVHTISTELQHGGMNEFVGQYCHIFPANGGYDCTAKNTDDSAFQYRFKRATLTLDHIDELFDKADAL